MAPSKASSEVTLRLERRIAASPEKVFAAWTSPEVLIHWFAPTPEFKTIVHEIDLRVGGRYRIEMRDPGGAPHTATGTYREVDAPRKLVFTWRWEEKTQMADTLVTVTCQPDGAGTLMVLLHENLADEADRDSHNKGWIGCLDRLPAAVR